MGNELHPTVVQTRHVLAVNNLSLSARYYMDTLGFKRDFAIDGWEFCRWGASKSCWASARMKCPRPQPTTTPTLHTCLSTTWTRCFTRTGHGLPTSSLRWKTSLGA